MHHKVLSVLVLLAVMAAVNITISFSEEKKQGVVIDLNTVDCRRLLKMTGDERDFTLTFFHGLISGIKQDMIFNAPVLAEATDQVINHCIDNPNDTLLKVFKAKRQ